MEDKTMAMPKSEVNARYVEETRRSEMVRDFGSGSVSYMFIKRSFDIFGAVIGLVLSSPIFLVVSMLYLFGENKGPVFFKQKRIGKNGQAFYIYKFRSMVVNAEEVLKANVLLYQKYVNNNYKLEPKEDPRITKLGSLLRKTSLDELPQFINVLKGEMSLVGPRPVVSEELSEYRDQKSKFLSAKPGVTGYWAACGRSDIEYPERCNVELYYIDHMSLVLDFKIIVLTIYSVMSRKGAY